MASVNKVIIVGHLGRDPEMRYLPSGEAVANFSVATSESWKDKATGEKQERTEWHRVNFFGKTAEVAGQYLKKGSLIYVEGSLQTRKWTDKEGIEKFTTEIRGDRLQMLGGKGERQDSDREQAPAKPAAPSRSAAPARSGAAAPAGGGFDDMADDVPFISCAITDDAIWKRLRGRSA